MSFITRSLPISLIALCAATVALSRDKSSKDKAVDAFNAATLAALSTDLPD